MAVTRKEMIKMNETACSVKGVLDNIRMQLQILDDEIAADKKSKMQFERELEKLETRKSDLQSRIKRNQEWVATYDVQVGPFADRYEQMTKDIGTIYDNAKEGHTKGIKLLEKDFDYHPLFKRPSDTFTGRKTLL